MGVFYVCVSLVAAESLIDLFQIVGHYSVVGDATHHGNALVTTPTHHVHVVLKVTQAVPLGDLVDVHGHLEERRRERKLAKHVNFNYILD